MADARAHQTGGQKPAESPAKHLFQMPKAIVMPVPA
jgi:hypothetical protein